VKRAADDALKQIVNDAMKEVLESNTRTREDVEKLAQEISSLRTDILATKVELKNDLKANLLAAKMELKNDLQAGRDQAKADLLATKLELKNDLKADLLAAKMELKNDLQAGRDQAKADLLATKLELQDGQLLANKKLIEVERTVIDAKQALMKATEEMWKRQDNATQKLEAATDKVEQELATAKATLTQDIRSDLGMSVVASANWIARKHNSYRHVAWEELAADGPDSDSFEIGAIDGSFINSAAPLGYKPEHDYELWFPRDMKALRAATVEQVDALLFFYAIAE
jgi:hypothetical protein